MKLCKNTHYQSSKASSGFALIASISIMAVLVLIGMTLYSLSSVAIKSADIAKARTEAQANAKMALMVAIGKLQETMGPDKRISARGSILAKHPEFENRISIEPESTAAWWVGAASSDPTETIGSEGRPVVWLLSGLDPQQSSDVQIETGIIPGLPRVPIFGPESIDLNLTGAPIPA